jgi:microcystin-dependent protein
MVETFTPNLGLTQIGAGDLANSWGPVESTNKAIVDNAVGGVISQSVAGNSNYFLTFTQGSSGQNLPNRKIILTGALTSNIGVFLPNGRGGNYIVENATAGAFTVTLANNNGSGSPAGRTVTAPQGQTIEIFSDGTNVDPSITTLPSPLPIAGGGTGASTLAGASIVTGPASAVSGNLASFADTTGTVVQDSGAAAAALVPTGAVMPFAGSAAPTGWHLCDGSSQLRAGAFANLFAVIGTTYGSVDGSHFTLPDLRGRAVYGFDSGNATGRLTASTSQGVSASTLGNTGGEQAHTLSTAELAAHNHAANVTDPGHGHLLQTGTGTGRTIMHRWRLARPTRRTGRTLLQRLRRLVSPWRRLIPEAAAPTITCLRQSSSTTSSRRRRGPPYAWGAF